MYWLNLRAVDPLINVAAFIAATGVVWIAGDRLPRYCRIIADRTLLGQAFIGTLLLGVTVSLPEITLAGVAAALGNAVLSVNSLLGGVAMVMVVVAITDAAVGAEPLSRDVQDPVVLLQAPVVIMMLVVTGAGITAGDRLLPGVGLAGIWTTALLVIYIVGLVLVKRIQQTLPWKADTDSDGANGGTAHLDTQQQSDAKERSLEDRSLAWVSWLATVAAVAVFIAGTVLALTADALAEQTGLGAGFMGLIFGGLATSLPELSTTISAVKLKQYEMAFSDAWGTNLCSIAVLFLADLLYPGGPILNEVGRFTSFAVLLGVAVTAVYLAGLIGRPQRSFLRMGIDSLAVLLVSAVGFVILYRIR